IQHIVVLVSNDEVDDLNDEDKEDVWEVRPMGKNKSKKKASSSSVPSESSAVALIPSVDLYVDKWKNVHSSLFSKDISFKHSSDYHLTKKTTRNKKTTSGAKDEVTNRGEL
ncbi:hypothetical protein Tco_0931215, partial [Tanacetum coccineum]